MTALKAWYAAFILTRYGAIINRVVIAGVTAGAGAFVSIALANNLFTIHGIVDLSAWHKALWAAFAAASAASLALVQSIITTLLTGAPQFQKSARRQFLGAHR